ncbi:hypothetical protein CRENBAI_018627 [Crenichthys baileyi]|uniref:Uncharacterized protein n=1 Tax=Crenichthys baileyi TaxID=28760 RepID=A0AAV9SH98_9TELE
MQHEPHVDQGGYKELTCLEQTPEGSVGITSGAVCFWQFPEHLTISENSERRSADMEDAMATVVLRSESKSSALQFDTSRNTLLSGSVRTSLLADAIVALSMRQMNHHHHFCFWYKDIRQHYQL